MFDATAQGALNQPASWRPPNGAPRAGIRLGDKVKNAARGVSRTVRSERTVTPGAARTQWCHGSARTSRRWSACTLPSRSLTRILAARSADTGVWHAPSPAAARTRRSRVRVAESGPSGSRTLWALRLLDLDARAGVFELGLGGLGGVLVGLLEDRLGGAVDEVLGLLEAQAGELADGLDDLDLLGAGAGEDDVELVLLLLGGGGSTATTGAAAAATATGAAAVTPKRSSNASSSSFSSSTVRAPIESRISSLVAMSVSVPLKRLRVANGVIRRPRRPTAGR